MTADHDRLLRSRRIATFGVEFDWLLVDRLGHVALCCSALDGEIPDLVLEIDEGQHEAFQEAINALSDRLPPLGNFREENGGMGADPASPELAKRGLYVFDWHGPYRRMLLPVHPTDFTSVQPHLGGFGGYVPVADLSFAETRSFRLQDLIPCR